MLGVFVPSGGSKWVIEAPYVMAAAHTLKVHLGWVVASYDLGEALANLVQPFWMLPMLGLFGLGARDVMGYTFVVFLALTPVVLRARDAAGHDAAVSAVVETRAWGSGHRLEDHMEAVATWIATGLIVGWLVRTAMKSRGFWTDGRSHDRIAWCAGRRLAPPQSPYRRTQ